MNGFTEHQASDASEAAGRGGVVLTWDAAQAMLPLVRRIVADAVRYGEALAELGAEKERLDRQRLTLAWPGRRRRYQVSEEIQRAEAGLQEARAELEGLGVALLDLELGQVGFPTIVNNRRAFFSWRPGDEAVEFWHFARSHRRRPVPGSWKDADEKKRKPGKN